MKFATKAIHVGSEPDPKTGAIMPPIYLSSTFELESPGHSHGYEYTRAGNPNFTMLEEVLASLQESSYATVFSSGIGAIMALASTLSQGDKVFAVNGIYGGTYRLFNQMLNRFGIVFINATPVSLDELDSMLKKHKPKWLMFETPTNPMLNIFDIEAFSAVAKKNGVLTVVDNTFASPYCQNPFKWGADVVWHSTTKFLGGHSDVLGGVVMTNDVALKKALDFARKTLGSNPSPFDAWLIQRGIKTLPVRMERHQENALIIANAFSSHPRVKRTFYPGLPSHPGHAIARKQMRGFSGMVTAEFNLTLEQTAKFVSSFKIISLAESLGGIESLVNHPASMTHATVPQAERLALGITDSVVRFSIGIEDSSDLLADIDQALKSV